MITTKSGYKIWYSIDSNFEKESVHTGYTPQILIVVISGRWEYGCLKAFLSLLLIFCKLSTMNDFDRKTFAKIIQKWENLLLLKICSLFA